MNETRGLEG